MASQKASHDNIFSSDTLPLKLGSPLKVPHYAWQNWSISYSNQEEFKELLRLSEKSYHDEWDIKTEKGHRNIALAGELAGLGNANKRLNIAAALLVNKLIRMKRFSGELNLLDIGAGEGGTTTEILEKIGNKDKKRIYFSLLDPAEKAIKRAEEKVKDHQLKEEDYRIIVGEDLDVDSYLEPESQDIVIAVAAIHHHAYLALPLEKIYKITKRGGFLIVGDWHNSMWEHPNRVYKMLHTLEWKNKDKDLIKFVELYPKASENAKECGSKYGCAANKQIIEFWKQYSKIETDEENQFFVLEGHRPATEYIKEMQAVGFLTDTKKIKELVKHNPQRILRKSSLLSISVGEKTSQ